MPATHGFSLPTFPHLVLRARRIALPLDGYSNIGGAWSVARRLLTSYTGPLIRLRRASDSAESDFGYGAFDLLDTTAIAAWAGGASFIDTIYDQSGNGRNMTNSTAAAHPAFQATGLGGRPTGDYDGIDDSLALATAHRTLFRNVLLGAVITVAANDALAGANNYIFAASSVASANIRAAVSITTATGKFAAGGRRLDADSAQIVDGTLSANNAPHVQVGIFDWAASNLTLRVDGAQVGATTSFQTDGATSDTTSGSIRLGNISTAFWNGLIAEAVAFAGGYPADFLPIEQDFGDFYGIRVP